MPKPETLRIAKSPEDLDRLLSRIESGMLAKPDWIRLQGSCRLDEMNPPVREKVLARIHPNVLRGFKDTASDPTGPRARLALWQSVARAGFHDFSEVGWMKNYDSPFVENYDYIADYQRGGIEALDPYKVYSSVLGTFDFTVDDFVSTELLGDVNTIVEPMAGTAEFCYMGHFLYPDFNYLMIDLESGRHVTIPDEDYAALDEAGRAIWERVGSEEAMWGWKPT